MGLGAGDVPGAAPASRNLVSADIRCETGAGAVPSVMASWTCCARARGVGVSGALEAGRLLTDVSVTFGVDGDGAEALETGRPVTGVSVPLVVGEGPRPGRITILVWPRRFGGPSRGPAAEVASDFPDEGEPAVAGPTRKFCRATVRNASGVERFLEKSLCTALVHAPGVDIDELLLTSWAS